MPFLSGSSRTDLQTDSVILRHNKNKTAMCFWILADLIRWKQSAGRGGRGRRSRLPSPRRPSSGSPPNHSRAAPQVTEASRTFGWGVNTELSSWWVHNKHVLLFQKQREYLNNLTDAEVRRAPWTSACLIGWWFREFLLWELWPINCNNNNNTAADLPVASFEPSETRFDKLIQREKPLKPSSLTGITGAPCCPLERVQVYSDVSGTHSHPLF